MIENTDSDNWSLSKLAQEHRALEESLKPQNAQFQVMPATLKRRLFYHQYKRAIWLALVLSVCVVLVYPTIKPLLTAAFHENHVLASTLLVSFLVAIFTLMIVEKLEDE